MPVRPIELQNRHPRLRVPAREVKRAIALLDARFQILPADLPTFSPAHRRAWRAQSKTENRKLSLPPGGCPPGELSLVFLTDAALAQVHADFMDDPTTTDVITFEGDPAAGLAGEICVSADTAARFVGLAGTASPGRTARKTAALQPAFAEELTLYLVHGWLHLAGYDDLQPVRKRRMRAAEARALKLLRAAGAVPAFRLN